MRVKVHKLFRIYIETERGKKNVDVSQPLALLQRRLELSGARKVLELCLIRCRFGHQYTMLYNVGLFRPLRDTGNRFRLMLYGVKLVSLLVCYETEERLLVFVKPVLNWANVSSRT